MKIYILKYIKEVLSLQDTYRKNYYGVSEYKLFSSYHLIIDCRAYIRQCKGHPIKLSFSWRLWCIRSTHLLREL